VPADEEQNLAPAGAAGQAEPLRIGAEVLATDGKCGELVRVIVNPVAQVVTHLVVAPHHHAESARLVPLELIDAADGDQIRLSCTLERFDRLEDAEEVQFLPANADAIGYGNNAMSWPLYGIETPLHGSKPMITDRVPLGEVDVRRGDTVHATDGEIGSVQGLVIHPKDNHVTHVLLKEGHFWGRKQVAIPIGAASRVGDEVKVDMTRQEIEDLPPVDLSSIP
jgi:sporulation protein YlmC with PRC-barrel domain